MKKIVVLSDTHGNISAIERLTDIMKESDYVFHLGDYQSDIALFNREFGDKIHSVKGNCDMGGGDEILDVEGVKIMITHGNEYGVKNGLTRLNFKAKEVGANVVFYGHTHVAKIEEFDGITFINPGALKSFINKTYCYAVVHNGKLTAKIVDILE